MTSANYEANYTYDKVGNRLSRNVTRAGILPELPDQNFTDAYDANDRLTDGGNYNYDNNGSTISHDGWVYDYDAEGHLLTATKTDATIVYIYDGDGIRVEKTLFGGTSPIITRYLTDDQNPTGYVQTVEELNTWNMVQRRYGIGLDLISQTNTTDVFKTLYYGYDGMGSTRLQTDVVGGIVSTYEYDAFGVLVNHIGTAENNYLFQGEYFDSDIGLLFLRARWMNGADGRFLTVDRYEGDANLPISLHKYLAMANDLVNKIDPSGKNFDLRSQITAMTINVMLNAPKVTAFAEVLCLFTGTTYMLTSGVISANELIFHNQSPEVLYALKDSSGNLFLISSMFYYGSMWTEPLRLDTRIRIN